MPTTEDIKVVEGLLNTFTTSDTPFMLLFIISIGFLAFIFLKIVGYIKQLMTSYREEAIVRENRLEQKLEDNTIMFNKTISGFDKTIRDNTKQLSNIASTLKEVQFNFSNLEDKVDNLTDEVNDIKEEKSKKK